MEHLDSNKMATEKGFLYFTTFVVCLTTSYGQSASAFFRVNPIDNDGIAIFACQVSNLGANTVYMERTIFSRTEPLASGNSVLPSVDDNFFLSLFNNNDGSTTYSLTIRGVYHQFDAGTYTCQIKSGNSVLTQSSAVLNINYTPESPDPRCSLVGSSGLTRSPGSEVRLACHSELGFPPVDIEWSYEGCNNGRNMPEPSLTDTGAYYSELRLPLNEQDNGGIFTCTISRPDGSFSRSCSVGPFVIIGASACDPNGGSAPPPPPVTSAPPPPQATQPAPTPVITASFQTNPADEGTTGILNCQVFNLGSNFVSIERRVSSTLEPLSLGSNVLFGAPGNIFMSYQNNNDGSQTYTLTVRQLGLQADQGTYTCKVESSQRQVLAMQSVVLQINAIAPPPASNPTITTTFQSNQVNEGLTAIFLCQVYDLGSHFVSIERRTALTIEDLALGTNVLPNINDNIFLSLRNNNDGSQTYTLTIRQAARVQDAGTYTCNVETYQRQIVATESAILQINAISITPPPPVPNPSVSASFRTKLLDEGMTAIFNCQVNNLGSNYIAIERRTSTTTEPLTLGSTVLPNVPDNVFLSSKINNDGLQTYTLSIRFVNRPIDAGTYTCQAVTPQRQILAMDSDMLLINTVSVVPTPEMNVPRITGSLSTNPVDEDTTVSLTCQVFNLGSNFVSIERTVYSTTESLTLGTQILPGLTDYLCLSVRNNNDGSQVYMLTISNVVAKRDAGVYSCKVENYQRQVLAMKVLTLQININSAAPTPDTGSNIPYVTASFQSTPVDEGSRAVLICQIYNLGSNTFVSIERTTSSQTEIISASTQVFPTFANRAVLSVQDGSSRSKVYILTLNRLSQTDAGTYICQIQTFQRKFIAMRSALLQVNSANVPFATSNPSVPGRVGPNGERLTASFVLNPIEEETTAILICRSYNLGSNFVSIERQIFSRTEQISVADQILPNVDDNVFISVRNDPDGSKSHQITIRGAHHKFDAGSYTCKIESPERVVLAQQSLTLNINYDPPLADPRCSIVGSDPGLTRQAGSEIRLGCHSELGYPPVEIKWSYIGCNENRPLPTPSGTSSGAHYSEIKVKLNEEDNGGYFVCTINRPYGSFRDLCSRGPFVINPGQSCFVKGPTRDRKDERNSSNELYSNKTVNIICLMSLFVLSILV